MLGDGPQVDRGHRAQASRRLGRFNLEYLAPHFIHTSGEQFLGIEGSVAGKQLVKENA